MGRRLRLSLRLVALGLMASCAPTVERPAAPHPAHPDAPAGRLAGPPAALRAGAAGDTLVAPADGDANAPAPAPAAPAPDHGGHDHDAGGAP